MKSKKIFATFLTGCILLSPIQPYAVSAEEVTTSQNGSDVSSYIGYSECECFDFTDTFVWSSLVSENKVTPHVILEKGQSFSIPLSMLNFDDKSNRSSTLFKKLVSCKADSTHTMAYKSENDNICTVSAEGMVKARKEGKTRILVNSGTQKNGAFACFDVTVVKPDRVRTKEYQSLKNNINVLYKKYGDAKSINKTNYKKVYEEVMAVDKQLKAYSNKVEKKYQVDEVSLNKNHPFSDDTGISSFLNISTATEKELVNQLDNEYGLTGWGNIFCNYHILCGNIWKMDAVLRNVMHFNYNASSFRNHSKNQFSIKSVKASKDRETLTITLKEPVSELQFYSGLGSNLGDDSDALIWSAYARNALKEKHIRSFCYLKKGTLSSGYIRYVGDIHIGDTKITFHTDNSRNQIQQDLPSGTYYLTWYPLWESKANNTYGSSDCFYQKITLQ